MCELSVNENFLIWVFIVNNEGYPAEVWLGMMQADQQCHSLFRLKIKVIFNSQICKGNSQNSFVNFYKKSLVLLKHIHKAVCPHFKSFSFSLWNFYLSKTNILSLLLLILKICSAKPHCLHYVIDSVFPSIHSIYF